MHEKLFTWLKSCHHQKAGKLKICASISNESKFSLDYHLKLIEYTVKSEEDLQMLDF